MTGLGYAARQIVGHLQCRLALGSAGPGSTLMAGTRYVHCVLGEAIE